VKHAWGFHLGLDCILVRVVTVTRAGRQAGRQVDVQVKSQDQSREMSYRVVYWNRGWLEEVDD